MHIVFISPHYPSTQKNFVESFAKLGVRLTGIGDCAWEALPPEVRAGLTGYERIGSMDSDDQILEAVRRINAREKVDLVEATQEIQMLTTARIREAMGLPGQSVATTILCRDKAAMKDHLRAAGIPLAASAAVNSPEEAREVARRIGYPVIMKPRDAAGAYSTTRIDSDADLEAAILHHGVGQPRKFIAIEEFIEGEEGFYDTLTVNGKVVFEAISHYYPNVLEAMRTRWISPQIITTNRVAEQRYEPIRKLGQETIKALGLQTTATHMEWFKTRKGYYFSEIGSRPPGAKFWDVYCWANDFNLYDHYCEAVVRGTTNPKPSRQFSAGVVTVRANRDGRVTGYSGIEEVKRRLGQYRGEFWIPDLGSEAPAVGAGYIANAYVYARHPDYDECKALLDYVGQTLKVWAE